MGALSFELKLTETFGAKLAGINPKLERFDRLLNDSARDLAVTENAFKGIERIKLPDMNRFFTFDIAQAAHMAIGAITGLIDKFIKLGTSIVKTAGAAQDLDLAVKLNLGTEGAAELDKLAGSFEGNTRLDDDRVKRALLPLTEIGIRDTELLDNVLTAATDLATRTAGRISVEDATDAFQKIALKGEVDPKILRALNIGQADYFKNLGQLLGKSAESAEKLAKAGKLDKATLISVALDELAKRQGGAIGGAALEGGKMLGATLERLDNLAENVFKKIASGPGMQAVQAALDKFIEQMKGPAGDKLIGLVDNLLTKLALVLTPENIEKFIKGVVSAVETLVSVMGKLYDIGIKVASVGSGFFDKAEKFGDFLWGRKSGADVAKGLAEGIESGAITVEEAARRAAAYAQHGVSDELDIHSPSRVMAKLGMQATRGFAEGMADGLASVDRATAALSGAASEGITMSAVAAGRSISVSFGDIVVQGARSREEAEEQGAAIEQRIRNVFHDVLRESAFQGGAGEG